MSQKLLPLVQAVEEVSGRRVHLSTVLRWCTKGCRGIRLDSRVMGGRRYTWREAVEQFIEATTIAKDGSIAPPKATPRQQNIMAIRSANKLAERLKKRSPAKRAA